MKLYELLFLQSESSNIPAVPEYTKPSHPQTLQGLGFVKKAGINQVDRGRDLLHVRPATHPRAAQMLAQEFYCL